MPYFPRIQPVHKWVQKRRNEKYQHAHCLLQVSRNIFEPVRQNGEGSHDLKYDQNDQLRHARVDGFQLRVGPLRNHARDQYLHVGERLDGDAHQLHEGRVEQAYDVVDRGVSARELEQRRVVAEHVHDHGSAPGEPRLQGEHRHDQDKVETPDERNDAHHNPGGHDGVVTKRHADGGVTVKGHGGQNEQNPPAVHVQQEGLQNTERIVDSVGLCDNV